jgi:tripartite-type tricarboxylate transporter receptor subunit TctC
VARVFAERFAERLRQGFVVENRPGANGNIAAAAVSKAEPDGYTILVSGNGQNAMNHSLYARMPYASTKDFEHICLLALSNRVEAAAPEFLNPDADQVARQVMSTGEAMERLAGPGNPAPPGA